MLVITFGIVINKRLDSIDSLRKVSVYMSSVTLIHETVPQQ